MRVAFVVQRCGAEVNGGAETLCLQIAQRMQRHWEVEILTTCALDYMTWENHFPEGVDQVGGASIRRFKVDQLRDVAHFDTLSGAIASKGRGAAMTEQEEWMRAQGPVSTALFEYLKSAYESFDAFIFFGYLYATTYFGLPLAREKAYLAPLAHDEWTIHLPMWEELFAQARGFLFQTPEELAFLHRRFPELSLEGPVTGIGVDAPPRLEPEKFRQRYDLADPFLLYVGRVDASKGCGEMFEWFTKRATRCDERLKLVLLGREVLPVPFHDAIIYPGFVSEDEKWSAMAACDWLLLPSRYESLSIALLETWAAGRPAIVNANSEVLQGHCRRSHGGLWYHSWIEVEAALKLFDDTTKAALGAQGAAYVAANYTWARVEAAYLRGVEHPEQSKVVTPSSPATLGA